MGVHTNSHREEQKKEVVMSVKGPSSFKVVVFGEGGVGKSGNSIFIFLLSSSSLVYFGIYAQKS